MYDYIYICINIYMCVYVYMYIYTYIYMYVYVYIYVYIYIYIYVRICIYILICIPIWFFVYVYIYTHIYMFIHVFIYTLSCLFIFCIFVYTKLCPQNEGTHDRHRPETRQSHFCLDWVDKSWWGTRMGGGACFSNLWFAVYSPILHGRNLYSAVHVSMYYNYHPGLKNVGYHGLHKYCQFNTKTHNKKRETAIIYLY